MHALRIQLALRIAQFLKQLRNSRFNLVELALGGQWDVQHLPVFIKQLGIPVLFLLPSHVPTAMGPGRIAVAMLRHIDLILFAILEDGQQTEYLPAPCRRFHVLWSSLVYGQASLVRWTARTVGRGFRKRRHVVH